MNSPKKRMRIRLCNDLYDYLKACSDKYYIYVSTLLQSMIYNELRSDLHPKLHAKTMFYTSRRGEMAVGGGSHQISISPTTTLYNMLSNASEQLTLERGYDRAEYEKDEMMKEYEIEYAYSQKLIITSCILFYRDHESKNRNT